MRGVQAGWRLRVSLRCVSQMVCAALAGGTRRLEESFDRKEGAK